MVPFGRYSIFPRSVDSLFKETSRPFKLILVEGNAPEHVRHELEKRKKKYKNIQILYSSHHPRMAEAFNLGLVHVRTEHVFLMHNHLFVTPGWLSELTEHIPSGSFVRMPYVSHSNGTPYSFLNAFLTSKRLLDEMGLTDLEGRLKAKNIPIEHCPASVLDFRGHAPLKGAPMKLFCGGIPLLDPGMGLRRFIRALNQA
jgi:glycosyltransferase involved in cell wall biosynthesis